MPTYALYIEDNRYSVPTLFLHQAPTEGRARAKATELLLQSPHHMSVEASVEGETVFTVRPARRASNHGNDDSAST